MLLGLSLVILVVVIVLVKLGKCVRLGVVKFIRLVGCLVSVKLSGLI